MAMARASAPSATIGAGPNLAVVQLKDALNTVWNAALHSITKPPNKIQVKDSTLHMVKSSLSNCLQIEISS
jgi:hypothetical protein